MKLKYLRDYSRNRLCGPDLKDNDNAHYGTASIKCMHRSSIHSLSEMRDLLSNSKCDSVDSRNNTYSYH